MKRDVGVRLGSEGGQRARRDFRDYGDAGKEAFGRIRDSIRPANRTLRLFNAAAAEGRGSLEGLANRAPGVQRLTRVLGPAGLLGGAAIGGLLALSVAAKSAASDIAEIGDAADRAQIDVDVYEQLKAALTIEGQSDATLEASLSSVVRKAGEARAGIGESVKTFQQLGIQLTGEGGRRKTDAELIDDIADAMQRLPDGATRAAFAQKLFEEGGRALVTVLDEGSEGLRDTIKEAENLGLLYGGELIRSAQAVNAQFGIQSEVVGVQLKTAFVQAAPLVSDLTDRFVQGLPEIIKFVDGVLTALGVLDVGLDAKIQQRAELAERIAGSRGNPLRRGQQQELEGELAALDQEIEALQAAQAQREAYREEIETAPQGLSLTGAGSDAKKEAEAFERIIQASAQRSITAIDQVEQIGQAAERAQFLAERARLVAAANQADIRLDDGQIDQIEESAAAFAKEAVNLEKTREAYRLLQEQKAAELSVSERQNENRERLLALLPQVVALTNDEAEARRLVEGAIDRTNEKIEQSAQRTDPAFSSLRNGFRSVALGVQSFEDAGARALAGFSERLFDLAFDPVWDILAQNINGLFSGAAGGGGGGILGSIVQGVGSLFVGASARGNVFAPAGVTPHSRGGVVNRPSLFSLGGNRIGSLAESRPEGVLPLQRTPSGDLGVIAQFPPQASAGANITIAPVVQVDARGAQDPNAVADATADAVAASVVKGLVDQGIAAQMRPGGLLDQTYQKKGGF